MEDFSFYGKTNGHPIKILVEGLNNCLTGDIELNISKDGIKSICFDSNDTLGIIFELKMNQFDEFYCDEDKTIKINLKQFLKLLKNIKKKDNLILFVKKNDVKFGVKINQPSSVERNDTSYINITKVEDFLINNDPYESFPSENDYNYPKIIPSGEYQKICKKMNNIISKELEIEIQGSNYISFSNNDQLLSTNTSFGTLKQDEKSYKGIFSTTRLNQLIKLPGLSHNIEIYSPKNNSHPLKIKMNISILGYIEIFLKNENMIQYEKLNK